MKLRRWPIIVRLLVFVILFSIPALMCFALYSGTTLHDLDPTRPPDTGELAKYGAAAIREIKKCLLNTLTNTIDLSSGQLLSNSVPMGAFQSNSVAFYALQTNTIRWLGGTFSGSVFNSGTAMKYNAAAPSNTQGVAIFSLTVTPTFSNGMLRIRGQLVGSMRGGGGNSAVAAIFTNSGPVAIAASCGNNTGSGGNDQPFTIPIAVNLFPGSTAALQINVRAGPADGGTLTINGNNGTICLGGVASSFLEVEEVRQ